MSDSTTMELGPRVATLETELRQVVKAISDQTTILDRVEGQIQALALALKDVGAPKQANWFALIGTAVSVTLLFITLGSLVLFPISKEIAHLQAWSEHHGDLELHPVGKTRIDALEKSALERAAINATGIRELDAKLQAEMRLLNSAIVKEVALLDTRLQREMQFISEESKNIAAVAEKNFQELKLHGSPALRDRITVLETILQQRHDLK